MNKNIIIVPRGIRYISEWEEYSLRNFNFPHILNKQLTGCGFTEYCLTNDMDIILCSPRRILLENKEDQHLGEVFYLKNELDLFSNYDKDLTESSTTENDIVTTKDVMKEEEYNKIYILKRNLLQYIDSRRKIKKPCKILVTYDSFHLVREFIESSNYYSMSSFQVVIDEFQSIFVDSRFKSGTEIKFLSDLYGLNRVCFVSATPMLDRYLEMLDEFKNLPYYELDWKTEDPLRVIRPNITVKHCKSLIHEAKLVIESYLNGVYEKVSLADPLGRIYTIESKEAVLYFNSVKNICDIIKKCGLTPDNTNVLCSDTTINQKKIKKAFKTSCGQSGGIGRVPGRDEPHKMFTLCTRTVYLGADFYSTCARSFIFSDANTDCLAVDISLDLPQILGRQRLLGNPWKTSAVLYFKTLRNRERLSVDDFDSIIRTKIDNTEDLINIFNTNQDERARLTYVDALKELTETTNYKTNYVSVNYDNSTGKLIPVFNNLVMVSEMRAFDIQQVDYKDRFSVLSAVNNITDDVGIVENTVSDVISMFESLSNFQDKMRLICTTKLTDRERDVIFCSIPEVYGSFYKSLGPERCSAMGYIKYKLTAEYNRIYNNQQIDLSNEIYNKFEIGKRYPLSDIKNFLSDLYNKMHYDSTAKATDLTRYFDLKLIKMSVLDSSGIKKIVKGYEILKIKNL